jgi:protein O-GlcNAc transferase
MTRYTILFGFLALSTTGCYQARNDSIREMVRGLGMAKSGSYSSALSSLAAAAKIDPTNHRALYYQGMICVTRLGEMERGVKLLQAAIAIKDTNYEYHYHLGHALHSTGKYVAAAASLKKGIELKPDHAESYWRLGMALEAETLFDGAQKAYRDALKRNGRLAMAYNRLGNLYQHFNESSHAAQVFKNGIENRPDFARNYHDLGMVYRSQERWADAVVQMESAINRDAKYTAAYFNLAMTYFQSGRKKKAMNTFKSYLARRGSNSDPLRVQTAERYVRRLEATLARPQ